MTASNSNADHRQLPPPPCLQEPLRPLQQQQDPKALAVTARTIQLDVLLHGNWNVLQLADRGWVPELSVRLIHAQSRRQRQRQLRLPREPAAVNSQMLLVGIFARKTRRQPNVLPIAEPTLHLGLLASGAFQIHAQRKRRLRLLQQQQPQSGDAVYLVAAA